MDAIAAGACGLCLVSRLLIKFVLHQLHASHPWHSVADQRMLQIHVNHICLTRLHMTVIVAQHASSCLHAGPGRTSRSLHLWVASTHPAPMYRILKQPTSSMTFCSCSLDVAAAAAAAQAGDEAAAAGEDAAAGAAAAAGGEEDEELLVDMSLKKKKKKKKVCYTCDIACVHVWVHRGCTAAG